MNKLKFGNNKYRSLNKSLTLRLCLVFFIILIIFSILACVFVVKTTWETAITGAEDNSIILTSYIEDLSETKNKPIRDVFDDHDKNTFKDICKNIGLDYFYIFEPSQDANKISYIILLANEEKYGSFNENSIDKNSILYTLSDNEKRLLDGEIKYATSVFENQYGKEIAFMIKISDQFNNDYILGLDSSFHDALTRISINCLFVLLFIVLIFVVILLITIFTIRKSVVEPSQKISDGIFDYATGKSNRDIQIHIKANNELKKIADSFNYMVKKDTEYIAEITSLTAHKNKNETELKIASNIQKSLLPANHYENKNFEIHASMNPCFQIGGDGYDYFELPNNKVLLSIIDVSGKGIAGCMCMALVTALIRTIAKTDIEITDMVSQINDSICQNNKQEFFVTAFIGIYDTKSNLLEYVNAGHNPSYVVDDDIKILNENTNVPLGVFENEDFKSSKTKIDNGQTLFMYTDGVTEAVNSDKKFFGDETLRKELIKAYGDGEKLHKHIISTLQEFSKSAEQSDDETMLSFTPHAKFSIETEAETSQFSKIKNIILSADIPKAIQMQLCTICEEVFTNICFYSYKNITDNKKVSFSMTVSDKIIIEFKDYGEEFNPTKNIIKANEYDIYNSVGGLGRLIVKEIADDFTYERKDNTNVLTLKKKVR